MRYIPLEKGINNKSLCFSYSRQIYIAVFVIIFGLYVYPASNAYGYEYDIYYPMISDHAIDDVGRILSGREGKDFDNWYYEQYEGQYYIKPDEIWIYLPKDHYMPHTNDETDQIAVSDDWLSSAEKYPIFMD